MDEIISDMLKLNLMSELSKEISQPVAELIKSNNIKIEDIKINPLNNELSITVESTNIKDKDLFRLTDEAIHNTINDSLSQYIYE